uniref:CYRIA/CYRIB Rac1 binding domain-containing protein n=1 Tax=Meloidogyne hapla TaxID=6305 RepID=A0A1I8B9Q1_MELHA
MQIQQQKHQQITNSYKNKCKPFVGCSFSFCTNFVKFSNGKISNYIFNNNKIKRVLSTRSEPPKCPAISLFPPLSENKNYIPLSGKQLCEELKQLISNTELAIIRLEQLNTQKNLLKEIDNTLEDIGNNKNKKLENEVLMFDNNENYVLVKQFVLQVKELFELAKRIETVIPSFFEELCCDCPQVDEEISSEQLLSKNFTKLLEATIRFDSLKIATPILQNAFSLFSDQIALFLSRPSPLFTALVNSAGHFIARQRSRELASSHLTEALIVIYNVLKKMLSRLCQKQQKDISNTDYHREFLIRSMMSILLLSDHIDRSCGGIFIPSRSPFDIADFIDIVKIKSSTEEAKKTLATLRFMSRHFSDKEIPIYIRKMFEIN